jgi:hypothetical protein
MQSVRSQTIVKAHLLNLFCNVFAPFLGRGLKLGRGGEKLRAPLGIRRCDWKSRNFSPSRSDAARRDFQAVPVNDGSSFDGDADAIVTGRVGVTEGSLTESLPVAVTIRADVPSASGHYDAGL